MFLLIPKSNPGIALTLIHLHSTMFLLIPVATLRAAFCTTFTFHYVSTYTVERSLKTGSSLIYIPLCFYLYEDKNRVAYYLDNLHSTMFLLIRKKNTGSLFLLCIYIPLCFYLYQVYRYSLILILQFTFHYVSTYTYFLPHPPLFFLLIFLLSNILLQKYELCRLPTFSALSQVDNHRKLLVLSSWMPQNSFGIHFSFLHLKIIKESLSSRMTLFNSIFSFRSCDSDISPSKLNFEYGSDIFYRF